MRQSLAGIGASVNTAALRLPPRVIRALTGPPVVVDGEPLQPAVQLMLATSERFHLMGDETAPVGERRAATRMSAAIGMPLEPRVDVADLAIPGPAGLIAARRYRAWVAGADPQPTILYLHGGGWVVGDLDTHDGVCRAIAVGSQCTVIAVDYRLAPEHPHPAAVDDAVAAFRWARDNPGADEIPGVVGIMGDSAGGNLAAVVCLVLRESGDAMPAAQGLIYPATDLRMQSESIDLFATGFFLTKASMEWFRSHYSPRPEQWLDPTVSPLLADSLAGLPPAAVWTAGFDPLRDEGAAYARLLTDAGVAVQYHCYADQVHGFASMGVLPGGMHRTRGLGRTMRELIRA